MNSRKINRNSRPLTRADDLAVLIAKQRNALQPENRNARIWEHYTLGGKKR